MSERVRAGLRRVKEKGSKSGRPVGRPRAVIDRERIRQLRDTEKLPWAEIARRLHSHSGTIRRVYKGAIEPSDACQNPLAEAL